MTNHSPLSQLGQRTVDPAISWLMKLTLDHPHLISLAAGFTDNESLPVREVESSLRDLLKSDRTARLALQYGSSNGDVRLRERTARDLQRRDRTKKSEVEYPPERVLITNGSQQLLYMLMEALCDPGDIVIAEDPSYFVYLGIVQSHALRCRGVKLEADGVNLSELERVLENVKAAGDLPRVKLLYLVSYYQNPSGITTSFEKKQGALDLLARYERWAGHPIYLLEDGAYRDLRFSGPDQPSALAVRGSSDRVIYSGTYSKPFATGARVGFGLLPETLFPVIHRLKGNHDFGTANFLQQLLVRAMVSGRYREHLPVMQARYAAKAQVMLKALRQHFPKEASWEDPRGGLYVWAKAPTSVATGMKSKLFQTALARDVLYVPGELCYADDPTRPKPNHEMRLSFGGATETAIRTGIARLGQALREVLRR